MNDEDENLDSLNPDGIDVDTDIDNAIDDDSDGSPTGDDLQERLAKLEEQNKRLYARLKKTEKKEPAKAPEPPKEPAPVSNDTDELKQKLTKLELRELGFKTQEEQEVVLNAAKLGGLTLEQAAENKFVKAQIEEMREESRVQNAIPSPSGKAGSKDTNSVDYYIRTGEIPEDDALADKVDEERIRRAKEQI
jgi:hypothetical protein